MMPRFCSILILFLLLTSCDLNISKENDTDAVRVSEKKNEPLTLGSDHEKGQVLYYANCISCHNYNPKKPGSIGPQVYGSSKELLSNKINLGIYPKNYKPKRSTKMMPLQPHSDKEIANLHAFLNAP
jgi:mono/diheme cytochrome c family protein